MSNAEAVAAALQVMLITKKEGSSAPTFSHSTIK